MENEFAGVMAKRTDDELLKILNSDIGDYQPAAMEAAKNEFEKRNLSETEIVAIKQTQEHHAAFVSERAAVPLNTFWKILTFIFPGIILLIVAWIFKSDGYERKTRELVRWTIYGFLFYFGIAVLIVTLSRL